MKSFEVQISGGFYIAAAFSVLLLPWNVLLSFAAASAVHELCHLVMLRWCKVPVYQIRLGMFGAGLSTAAVLPGQELVCAAAGPAGSLLLACFVKQFPLIALFGFVQGLFNLLPIYPLDGGRILRSIFMLAKRAFCDYNSPDYLQRGINHDATDSADSAVCAETGPVYRRRI